jgi:hypothetical protein
MSQSDVPIDIKLATAKQKLNLKSKLSGLTKLQNTDIDDNISRLSRMED